MLDVLRHTGWLIAAVALSWGTPALSGPGSGVRRVRVATVTEAPPYRPVVLHGVTRAADRATLAFSVSGRLLTRNVRIGQALTKDDVVATIDPAPLEAAHRAADAQMQSLQAERSQLARDRARLEQLQVGTTIAQSDLETLRARETRVAAALAGAQAQAREAHRVRSEATLRSPLSGTVVEVLVEPGEMVQAGQPVVRVSGADGLEVEVQAPERVWARLLRGGSAQIRLASLGRTVPGTIRSLAQAAGPSGLMPVVVSLDPSESTAGLTADVVLSVPLEQGVVVPLATIVDPVGGAPHVFTVREGTVQRLPIAPGAVLQDEVVVSGPLAVGDQVVVAGQDGLLSGDPVEVLP